MRKKLMRSISLQQSELSFQANTPEPVPGDGEVIVDVRLAGICETDLQLCRGYMGFSGILGHEFIGVARSGRFEGQRVVGEINCTCQHCQWCMTGMGNHCPNRTVLGILNRDGAFADCLAIPESNLHAVPDSVSDDQAVFTEPLAAALQISKQVDLSQRRVVVLGDGRLGILCGKVAKLFTDDVCAIGKHEDKLQRFHQIGIETQILSDLRLGMDFDVVIDCTGSPTGLETACQLVKPRGTIVMKTTVAGNHSLSLASIVINEINLVGSRCGPFAEALNVIDSKDLGLDDLISHRFAIEEGILAMKTAASPDAFKVLLHFPKQASAQ